MSTTQVNATFQETQLQFGVTFAELAVPGIGDEGVSKLVAGDATSKMQGGFAGGITNAAQVVGYYLRLNGDCEKMRALLVDKCGCHAPSVDPKPGTQLALKNGGTLAALALKCEGFIAPEVDTSFVAPVAAAVGTTQVMSTLLSKQMSWKDTFKSNPVPGLGPAGRARMEADGITNVVQLVGLFMMLDGDEEEFVKYLRTCEIAERYIRSERTKKGTVMPGVLEAISNKATAICSQAEEERNVAMETVHEDRQEPATPVRAAGSPVFTPSTSAAKAAESEKQAGGGWEETKMRKRAAAAGKDIDSAATETPAAAKDQPASEATCSSTWLLPVLGVAACAVVNSMM